MLSLETKRKIAEAAKRRWANPTTRQRMLDGMNKPDAKRRRGNATRKGWQNSLTKKRRSDAISKGVKRLWEDSAFRERHINAVSCSENKERIGKSIARLHNDLEYKEKYVDGMNRPGVKEKRIKAAFEYQNNPEVKAQNRKRNRQRFKEGKQPFTNTKPHREVIEAMRREGLYADCQSELPVVCESPEWEGYSIDIGNLTLKVAIEIDGCFYHGCLLHCPEAVKYAWIRNTMNRDKAKTSFLRNRGWVVLRFWEHDIEKRLSWVIDSIRQVFTSRENLCVES
jgi:very-short-patch-repair endonuclease